MPTDPQTYDEWLALSEDERDATKCFIWNAYRRSGVAFAFTAACRLAMQSRHAVLDIAIGTYHGGEYVLHMIVSEHDFKECPPFLDQRFEGFRVVWQPERSFAIDPVIGASIEGKWIADESSDNYEFEFRLNAAGVDVTGHCRKTNQPLLIQNPSVIREYVLFSAYNPGLAKHTSHSLRLVTPNRAEDNVTKSEFYRRFEEHGSQRKKT
jgi:hypothetical protein